ncbi:hypothetical protein CHS0354_018389 [Potamilus streckersoni]|uniref:Sigma-54-dependent Fis family transcriptional regulator n=1 Tax=Potamilus streckersoni TaxID=2493646 RepID=A0AAE0WAZ2_9BIVA|nr:hypothetical protein CHS0354_018389 [Potamilus streckersoni]
MTDSRIPQQDLSLFTGKPAGAGEGAGPPVFAGISILIIHSMTALRHNLKRLFESLGAEVNVSEDIHSITAGGQPAPHLAVCEWQADSAPETVQILRRLNSAMLIYMLSKDADYEITRRAFQLGVTDILNIPFKPEALLSNIFQNLRSTQGLILPDVPSKVMQEALFTLPRIARSDFNVLITGETGTGKELIARAVHDLSGRSEAPFITVNCGAIPETLIESELFGHERGAFTGAVSARRGKFELAEGGTVFLDEIGDMPLKEQVKLLRVLEEHKIERVGGEKSLAVNIRIIAATSVNLEEAVRKGSFREDLFFRLNTLNITMPPLRERAEDIILLARHYLKKTFTEIRTVPPYPMPDDACRDLLMRYTWPGNVRELRNVMTRTAILLNPGRREISVADIPYRFDPEKIRPHHTRSAVTNETPPAGTRETHNPPSAAGEGAFTRTDLTQQNRIYNREYLSENNSGKYNSLPEVRGQRDYVYIAPGETMADIEMKAIRMTLAHTGGNKSEAARLLNISTRTLHRKLNPD